MACAPGYTFADFGVQACQIDTDVPGKYNITFWVTDSASNARVSVLRSLVVLAECSGEEQNCQDGTCSVANICSNDDASVIVAQNTAPVVTLRPVEGQASGAVLVPRGFAYTACSARSLPTVSTPCEPGERRPAVRGFAEHHSCVPCGWS